MGTLANQDVRNQHNVGDFEKNIFFEDVIELSKKHKLTPAEIIAGLHVMAINRSSDLYLANGDIHDEQQSGFGEIFRSIAFHLETISEK
jgi:hypothetical protein